MTALDEQIHQAVTAALNPGPLQSEATNFLQELRSNPKHSWEHGLICFLAIDKYTPQTRLFGLQLVDAMLTSHQQDQACYQTTREQLWDYIQRQFINGDGEQALPYLRNKLVQTIFLLFFQSYPNSWPDFFKDFARLIRQDPQHLNPRTTDLYLRLLHEISSELSDAFLRINKSPERLAKDADYVTPFVNMMPPVSHKKLSPSSQNHYKHSIKLVLPPHPHKNLSKWELGS